MNWKVTGVILKLRTKANYRVSLYGLSAVALNDCNSESQIVVNFEKES